MKASALASIVMALFSLTLPACSTHREKHHAERQKIITTSPEAKDVTFTQQYVCLILSRRHIEIRALKRGYLEAIKLKEGQAVKAGETMFSVIPILYQTALDAEKAELERVQLEYKFANKLFEKKVVSQNEVALKMAIVKKTEAELVQARAELDFATIKAPFDGIIDRLSHQQGSLVEEGEVLTTLSDNSVMWVYFNVPESRYLEYLADVNHHEDNLLIELVLANGDTFPHSGKFGAVEADFNNQTGTVPFRADFPNPDGLLRHRETGKVLISKVLRNAIVIPQRAVFELLGKRYVYVVDSDDMAHQREIEVQHELEDIFVIKSGVGVDDKIVLEGIRQVREGEKLVYENRQPEQVLKHLKYHAE